MDTTSENTSTPPDTEGSQPKHVSFNLIPEDQIVNTSSPSPPQQISDTNSTGKLGNKSESFNETPDSLRSNYPQQARPVRYKRGLNACFLHYNPRYINEPICHVLPNETSKSVGDCLHWRPSQSDPRRKVTHSLDSTSRTDYQQLPGDQRPPPLSKHLPTPRIHGTAPLVNEVGSDTDDVSLVREKISYRHQYNCRTDPNEPVRGKLHGSFVWKPV